MKKNKKIEQEVLKTMDLFQQRETLPPNPYFYYRIRQRLEERNTEREILSGILKPALLTLLILFNIFTAYWYIEGSVSYTQTGTRKELIEILAGDLNLDKEQTNLFNIE